MAARSRCRAAGFTRADPPVAGIRRRAAFTLVELLVVIGIIAVLIAILMPALGKVRKHAQEVHCAANLRSIGQALFMYTEQFHYYPGSHSGGVAIWPVRLRAFLGRDRRVFNCPAQDALSYWTEDGPRGAAPPATDLNLPFGYEPGER
jgi:prepilin-type N-terminal cleavage/methylation domain-containing protein